MNWWWQIKSSIINVPRENFCFYDLLLLLRFAMNFRFSRTGKCHRQSLNFNSPRTLNLSLNTTTALSHLDTSRSKRFFSLFLLFFFFFLENSQSLRPKLAIPSRVLTSPVGLPLPDADRNPPTETCCCTTRGALEESSLRINWGTQHVISHDGPEHPPSSRTPPPTQQSTVSVQLSHGPSIFHFIVF